MWASIFDNLLTTPPLPHPPKPQNCFLMIHAQALLFSTYRNTETAANFRSGIIRHLSAFSAAFAYAFVARATARPNKKGKTKRGARHRHMVSLVAGTMPMRSIRACEHDVTQLHALHATFVSSCLQPDIQKA